MEQVSAKINDTNIGKANPGHPEEHRTAKDNSPFGLCRHSLKKKKNKLILFSASGSSIMISHFRTIFILGSQVNRGEI